MHATKQLIFWDKIHLKNESQLRWLFNEVKEKPSVFRNILQETVHQLTENNESETVVFTLDNLMELEFKAWLCICEHEYLKLVYVTLFEKIIDHNLIYDHDSFDCQELINSGILMINLAVFKLFIDDINSFSIEEWKRLYQTPSHATPMEESVISQYNKEVKTDSLYMTSITNPEAQQLEIQDTLNTGTTALISESYHKGI